MPDVIERRECPECGAVYPRHSFCGCKLEPPRPLVTRRYVAECSDCGGTGLRRVHSHEDYGVSFESETCESCALGQAILRAEMLEEELQDARDEIRRRIDPDALLRDDVVEAAAKDGLLTEFGYEIPHERVRAEDEARAALAAAVKHLTGDGA